MAHFILNRAAVDRKLSPTCNYTTKHKVTHPHMPGVHPERAHSVDDLARSTQWRNKSNNIIASVSTLSTQPALGAGYPPLPTACRLAVPATCMLRTCSKEVRAQLATTRCFHFSTANSNLRHATCVELRAWTCCCCCFCCCCLLPVSLQDVPRQADCPFRPQSLPQTEIEEQQHLRQHNSKHFAANSILLLVLARGLRK